MADLRTQLHAYLDETSLAVDVDELISELTDAEHAVHPIELAPLRRKRPRPVLVLAVASVLTLLVIGAFGLTGFLNGDDPDVIKVPPTVVTTLPAGVVTTLPEPEVTTATTETSVAPVVTLPPLAGPEGSFRAVDSFNNEESFPNKDLTLNVSGWVHELWFFDDDTWRRDVLEGSLSARPADYSGTSYLHTGGHMYVYRSDGLYPNEPIMDPPWPPQRVLDPRDDLLPDPTELRTASDWNRVRSERQCSEATGEIVAGRPTLKLTCLWRTEEGPQNEHLEIWSDLDTGLFLRLMWSYETGDPASPDYYTASQSHEVIEIEYEPDFPAETFQPPVGSRVVARQEGWDNACNAKASGELRPLEVTLADGEFSYRGPNEIEAGIVEIALHGPPDTEITLIGLAPGVTPETLLEGIARDLYQNTVAESPHLPIELAVAATSVTVCQDSVVANVQLLPGTHVILGGRPLNQAHLIATITAQESD
jgi:hypothetical protein